jgi:hypothetical protein
MLLHTASSVPCEPWMSGDGMWVSNHSVFLFYYGSCWYLRAFKIVVHTPTLDAVCIGTSSGLGGCGQTASACQSKKQGTVL